MYFWVSSIILTVDANETQPTFNLLTANEQMKTQDEIDRRNERERIRQKHQERKEKARQEYVEEGSESGSEV